MKNIIISAICALGIFSGAAAQGDTFAFADYTQGKVFLMEKGKITWEHAAPDCNDLWVLPNGNILFTTGHGVLEMTTKNDTVFHYSSRSAIFACQRLENGNTFIGECNTARLLEVAPDGTIVKEVSIMPKDAKTAGGQFMRNARRLASGNYLVAHYGPQKVTEYNDKGETVWSVDVPGGPHSCFRMPNGNTMVAVADMTRNPRIVELDKEGKTVWEMSNADLEGEPFKFLGGMHLVDGTLMVSNWLGHGQEGKSANMFLIDMGSKKVISSMGASDNIRTISSVYRYDDVKGRKGKKWAATH